MRINWLLAVTSFAFFSFLLSACGGGSESQDGDNSLQSLIKPVADSGLDQEVIILSQISLDAGGSSDSSNKALTYSWTLSAPSNSITAALNDPSSKTPVFTPDVGGRYTATLTVNNGESMSQEDSVSIVVLDQLTNNPADDGHPYYNSDGSKIVFHSNRGTNSDYNIWIMDADGSNVTQLTTHQADDRRPHWSPDDSQIVFHSNRSGNQDLYIMNADGSGTAVQITSNSNNDSHPNWHPVDDSQILYQSRRGGVNQIRLKIVGQSTSSPLIRTAENNGHPMWNSDGSKIAFGRRASTGENDIWIADSDGNNLLQLTNSPTIDEQHPDWSPDNNKIAFRYVLNGEKSDIWTMNSDGSNKVRTTHHIADDRNPDWHPDGNKIMFRSDRTGNNEIFVYPLAE